MLSAGALPAIAGTATSVPKWFTVVVGLPTSPGARPAWGLSLGAGRYALVAQGARDGTLYPLTELTIR